MKREICTCRASKTAAMALTFALAQGGLVAQSVNIPDPNLKAAIRAELEKPSGDITVADMESLTELITNGISDLTGLEKAINITNLQVGWSYSEGLHWAEGIDNSISDLSPIAGLNNLRKLGVLESKIKEIGPLANLTNLRELELSFSEIDDFGPLAELTSLTELNLRNNDIRDLSPLGELTNLTVLVLAQNEISDLSPLAGLTNLTRLDLLLNAITDISPLAGLTSLTELNLEYSEFRDLGPLAGLTSLTELYLKRNEIRDLSPLGELTNLTVLLLAENEISDLSPLAGLTNLTRLALSRNAVNDLGPLAELTNLTVLLLAENEISDLSPLAGLSNLTWIGLYGNRVSDLSPLAGLGNLTGLDLEDNVISDLSPLADLTNLTFLQLEYNKITDPSPLANLTNLVDEDSFERYWEGWRGPFHLEFGLLLSDNYIDITLGSPARLVIDKLDAIEGLTVSFDYQWEPEPLIGGLHMKWWEIGQDDWYSSDWWGEYNTTFAPWIFHAEHGFLYRDPSSTNESMFIYDNGMGAWCWTNETIYPFIYAFNPPADNGGTDVESCWLFYFEDSSEPRSFAVVTGDHLGSYLYFNP